jgi:lipid-binding SYLF domain-containing protein
MRNTKLFLGLIAPAMLGLAVLPGCVSTAPQTAADQKQLSVESHSALSMMKDINPGLQQKLNSAYGWVVFPEVGKGGVGFGGGAFGRGEVYEQGKFVGYADITAGSLGPELGGQTYTEVVVFQNKGAMDNFKANHLTLSATASAVALKASADAQDTGVQEYDHGVAVYLQSGGGMMLEASIGGQQFTYQPADQA